MIGVPPVAATRFNPTVAPGANRTSPSRFQVPPLPPGAIGVYTPEIRTSVPAPPPGDVVGTTGIVPQRPVIIARRPESNDGIWIRFRGARWIHAGPAVPLADGELVRVGDHAGFPVYARRGARDVIYLPTRDGTRAAPYRLKR